MPLHEIGFLMIGGLFHCWFWSDGSPCPNAEKVRPAGIFRGESSEFETALVSYDLGGFTVFDQKNGKFEIKKKSGERRWLALADMNRQVQSVLPATTPKNDVEDSLWRFVSLDSIYKDGLIFNKPGTLNLIRQDDLRSPVAGLDTALEAATTSKIEERLKDKKRTLPVARLRVSVPCTYQKMVAGKVSGMCAAVKKVPAYSSPDRNSAKILDASLNSSHFEGFPVPQVGLMPAEIFEELLVFQEQGDWLQMRLSVLEVSKRVVWVHRSEIPFKMQRLDVKQGFKEFLEALNYSDPPLAEEFAKLTDVSREIGVDSAGETKWAEGILWVKVHVMSEPHCGKYQGRKILSGWLPYIDPATKGPVLGFYAKGC